MSTSTATAPNVSSTMVGGGGGNHHHSPGNLPGQANKPEQIMVTMPGGRCGPSLVTLKNLRFLITDKPTEPTLTQYIEELQRRKVTDVVRVCESTYSAKRLEQAGIKCHDWAFDDGTPPPSSIITEWLNLVLERFKPGSTVPSPTHSQNGQPNGDQSNSQPSSKEGPCIAVHCVAGLGRAPVLVAIALIETGMKYEDAVEMIRDVRRGAINAKQLEYLAQYKPKKVLVPIINGSGGKRKTCCIV